MAEGLVIRDTICGTPEVASYFAFGDGFGRIQPEYAVAELVICFTNEYLSADVFWPTEYLCLPFAFLLSFDSAVLRTFLYYCRMARDDGGL